MNYTIATLGSHSALQILKGATEEGFATLLVCLPQNRDFYRRFPFIDTIVSIENYRQFPTIESRLLRNNCIIIPHGSFVAYLGSEGNKQMRAPYFGNKNVLDWEEDRGLQRKWLREAKINVPKEYSSKTAKFPVIVKSFGATGGSGYAFAANQKQLTHAIRLMGKKKYVIQEYVIGVTCYMHYFYSPLTKSVELMSIDRRYETNVDGIGRIPLRHQKGIRINPTYVVVGNSPLVLRESLLPEAYAMGERIIQASRKLIDDRGLIGPFCLETIVTPDQQFVAMEISCRIVAGTNLFTDGSPYSHLIYDEPMSTGRRIMREIKLAIQKKAVSKILSS